MSGLLRTLSSFGVVTLRNLATLLNRSGAGTGGAGGYDGTEIDDVLTFTSTNEYDPVTGSPWAHIAEPYRKTTLTASSTVGNLDHDVFTWTFDDNVVVEGR